MAWAARRGVPAFAIGCVTLADALLARWLLWADSERVSVLGHPIMWVCAFRSRFGLPCPTCGLTRSVVMSLHGEFAQAWRIAPAGPVAVVGLLAFAAAMLMLAWSQAGARRWEPIVRVSIRKGAAIYAAALIVVWLSGWAASFHAALLSQ